MLCMASKKKTSGKHQVERSTIQLPKEWTELAKRLAKRRPLPTMWLIVELLRKEAEAMKEPNVPPVPWDMPE